MPISDMGLPQIIIMMLAFFIANILVFDSAYAAVSEGCEIFEIREGCIFLAG